MSWLLRLYKTYEAIEKNKELQEQGNCLKPYYHIYQNIQIIVSIDDEGNFIRAELCRDEMDKVKSVELSIPASNDSASRTSKIVAHPLSDKLQYVAKDFCDYTNGKKAYYAFYERELSAWCQSKYAHPKAKAVLKYVQKGRLVSDLIEANILIADPEDPSALAYPEQARDYPDSILSSLAKGKKDFDQGSAFVAWRVMPSSLDNYGDAVTDTWRDPTLSEAWQMFYASLDGNEGFCYITGRQGPLASKHPKRILRSANNAKLISSNDLVGFTFLGRFTDTEKSTKQQGMQAANVSAVVTEKAHSALLWLLEHQGREEAGQAVVAWAISGKETPQPAEENRDIRGFDLEDAYLQTDAEDVTDDAFDIFEDDTGDDDFFEDSEDDDIAARAVALSPLKVKHVNDIGAHFAKHLSATLQGYRQKLDACDQISIISLESATPGRMAVTYYYESMSDDYINALELWYQQFSWYFSYRDKDSKAQKLTMTAPTPSQIAEVAYGEHVSDALKKQVLSKVLPCIVEGETRQMPRYLVDLCFKRACNPLALENWRWEQALSVACALYRGYYLRHLTQKRSYNVALQMEYNSRDYLYGRLLAVAEDIESLALYIAGEKRNTTAQRYMQQFANRPFTTWRNIELALKPYENRLKSSRAGYLNGMQNLLDQVMQQFEIEDFNNDSALSGEFLLGYHSQRMQLKLDKKMAKKKHENIED